MRALGTSTLMAPTDTSNSNKTKSSGLVDI